MPNPSLWSFIADAGMVVKLVMLILFAASIFSWAIIIQRSILLKQSKKEAKQFEHKFWSGINLTELFHQSEKATHTQGLQQIFKSGFAEFSRLNQQGHIQAEAIMEGSQRSMRIAQAKEIDRLEKHLSFLATVGSTSPYIGLFGTVCGIMTSFQALGSVQQATIAMVAPGISEALVATAIGLFAAIPAVIAYNRFSSDLDMIQNSYATFQDEFTGILHREAHKGEIA